MAASVAVNLRKYLTVRTVFLSSIAVRAFLLVYGEWQDRTFALKFTDIDYHVFNDAAKHLVEGRSPFLRPTYRYTPLLAFLLTLNHYCFFSWGKVVFVCCDLGTAWIIHQILTLRGVGKRSIIIPVALWLLNPLTATVSSRGNAESILAALVLLTLYLIMCKRVYLSAVFFGFAVHMKIFPVIYALPLFLFIDENFDKADTDLGSTASHKDSQVLRRFFSPQRVKFVFASIATFTSITLLLYVLYGEEFIREAYLYHVTRRDIRHNFSVYFYMMYLIQNSWLSLPVGILAFLPQGVLLLASSYWLHKDITLCCFVQTFVFVTFNKVCTSQYFLWYLCLLPLVIPCSRLNSMQAIKIALLWFAGQALWLLPAYLLEFQGYNTFVLIWLAGLVFFLINVYILVSFLSCQTVAPVFQQGRILSMEKIVSKLS